MTVLPQLENELLRAHERLKERRAHGVRGLISRLAAHRRLGQPGSWRLVRLVRLDRVVPVVGVLVVVGVAVVFLGVRSSPQHRASSSPRRGGIQLVYLAERSPESDVNRASLERAIDVMRRRADNLGVAGVSIRLAHGSRIVVTLPGVAPASVGLAERALGSAAQLSFYDWEANALTPNGETVASQLVAQERRPHQGSTPSAILTSQGNQGVSPGTGAGGLALYQAVQLAAKQPPQRVVSAPFSRYGDQYYLFAASGSTACAIASQAHASTPQPGGHCLLSGPLDLSPGVPRSRAMRQLAAGLPAGVRTADGQLLVIKQGTLVLQAAPSSFSDWPAFGSATATYYVLKDQPALRSGEITNITPVTDHTATPKVTFQLSALGHDAFHLLTAQIAKRGATDSLAGVTLDQQFAVALDDQLLAVSAIDFKAYPNGITAAAPAAITGRFTTTTAQQLAYEIQLGAMPVKLQLISETPLAAHH